MRLPNPDYAIIDDQKLAGYCLNPEHTDGQHKAVVFQSALGIGVDEIKELSLFCHSPVFPIINIFYKGGILGNTAFAHLILAISLL